MLLTGGRKCTHWYEGLRSPHASALHSNPPGFRKKKFEYFSNILVYIYIYIYVCVCVCVCAIHTCTRITLGLCWLSGHRFYPTTYEGRVHSNLKSHDHFYEAYLPFLTENINLNQEWNPEPYSFPAKRAEHYMIQIQVQGQVKTETMSQFPVKVIKKNINVNPITAIVFNVYLINVY